MVLVLAAVPAAVLTAVLFVVLGMVLVVALVPPELALARPPQAPSGARPRPGLPSWTGPPSRPAGLARRLLLRRGCLARDGATAPALGGLAAGAAFDLWCAGGGENKGEKSAGGVEKGVHLQVYGSGLRNKFSGHIRQFSRAVRRARVGGGEGARCCSVFFPASATGEVGWSTQHEISNPSLSPPPPHTVPAASTYLAACSPPGAPPSGAPRRAGGHRIAQMLFRDGGGPAGFVDRLTERFSGRRRHRARSSRRFLI